ncbi:MAG: hypothetical protein ACXWRZ_01980 [Bdellovibrio sp.]
METQSIWIIKRLLFVAMLFSSVEIFAHRLTVSQIPENSGDKLEAGFEKSCNCSNGFSQKGKIQNLDIQFLKNIARDPVLEKYHAYDVLDRHLESESSNSDFMPEKKNNMELHFNGPTKPVSLDIKNNSTEGGVKVEVTDILAAAAGPSPVVNGLTKKVKVTAQCKGRVTDKGAEACQEKEVGLETKKVDAPVKAKVVFSKCDQNTGYLYFGDAGGCSYKDSLSGLFGYRYRRFSTEIGLSSKNLDYRNGQADVIFKLQF